MKKFLNEFKAFAIKGNMVDMAVGVVIGAAFGKIITGIVECIINPLISLVLTKCTGQSSTEALFADLLVGPFPVGQLVSIIIDFIITAFVLFVIVKAINGMKKQEIVEEVVTTKQCPYCKSEIDIEATKCPHCTSEL